FHLIRDRLNKFCENFDVVIFMADLHYISYCLLPFRRRTYKVIPWTIGIRASYARPYNLSKRKNLIDRVFLQVMKKSDAIIFYTEGPKKYWGKELEGNEIFIANNTVRTLPTNLDHVKRKNNVLFVGTLYKEKGVKELVSAFLEAKRLSGVKEFLTLEIVGMGPEYEDLKKIIGDEGISETIFLRGPIYNEVELKEIFEKTILCISPHQAGLSVLKSMGYGVPFVTRSNSITGGEIQNIIDKENGILYDRESELVAIILDAFKNPRRFIEMGEKAQKYYKKNATPEIMARGVLDAIYYVTEMER
ncbi:glycosyltransferase family 4 protein, partial [Akkermansiaceae bacterium]|nr:glycosyltransferase family 4 protein [Akkermansiaceae bacterium]